MHSLLVKLGIGAVSVFAAALLANTAQAPQGFIPQFKPAVEVVFFGDMMLDRGVARRAAGDGASLVAGVRDMAQEADLVVLNLEGTITTNESIAQRDNKILRFTFEPAVAEGALKALGVDVVSLANNHALDFYDAGYETTRSYLDTWGVGHFGHPLNNQNLSTMVDVEGLRLCFVGYHELYNASTATVVAEIGRIRAECGKIIVIPHWGPEYEPLPSAGQIAEAHAFIDAGADMVVGAHPHVVQPIEVYQGRLIAYSLGNFVFDQDFSWETRHGLALKVRFSEGETTATLVPLAIQESKPTPLAGEEAGRVLGAAGGVDTYTLP